MQVVRFALRNLWRDLKSGELSVLLLALSVAVLSLTAVGFFTSRISQGVRAQAAEVLAADLRLEAPNPLPPKYFSEANRLGLKAAQVLSFPTAIFNGDFSQLSALNAVTADYPLRGRMRIADVPFGPARATDRIPKVGEVWIDARIIAQLKVSLGDSLRIGAGSFRVAEVLDYRPDQGTGFVNLAPAALLNYDDVASTQLIQPGSRVTYAALFAGPAAKVADFREYLVSTKAPGERLREVDESSRQLNSAIDRASRFLNLASLASVLLAAVAVAMGARRYAARHIDTVALMKCMGASQGFVLSISLIELTLLAVSAVAAGASLGYLAQSGLAWLLRDLIRTELPAALRPELLAGARRLVRDSMELGARHGTGVLRPCRRVGGRSGAHFGGLRPGAAHGPAARRRGSRLALRPCQCLAARRGQRRANRRVRLRVDGAAVAGSGARRSARRLAAQPSRGRAQQFSDQHPPGGAPILAGIPAIARVGAAGHVSDGACAHYRDQFAAERVDQAARRCRSRVLGTRAEPDLGCRLDGRQSIDRRVLVDTRGRGQALGIHLDRISRGLAAEIGRQDQLRCRGRIIDRGSGQHPQDSMGQLSAELLSGVSARAPGRRRRHLYDQRVSDPGAAAGAGRSGASVPDDLGFRRRCHSEANPRHHGPRISGRSVCLSVHSGGGNRRAAGGRAVDTRRAPL